MIVSHSNDTYEPIRIQWNVTIVGLNLAQLVNWISEASTVCFVCAQGGKRSSAKRRVHGFMQRTLLGLFGEVCATRTYTPKKISPPKVSMTMENQPFQDLYPIQNGDFSFSY